MRIALAALLTTLFTQSPTPALRIVVIEGEGAVNIIQQKTAVRPVVEVRDRNNVPVPGATVTFTIGSGQPAAFAGGAPMVTVTTNASGQAPDGAVTGGPAAITFTTASSDLPITKATFTGSLSGSTITGQLTIEETTQTATGGQTFGGHGTGTATVTLTK